MTADAFFKEVSARLTLVLGPREGTAAARIVFEDVAGYDRKRLFVDGDREITEYMQGKINAVADAVCGGVPVQYAVGKARFMGLDFKVSPVVLIPRPETEGLVDLIIDGAGGRRDLQVLDIGTGSGCIAVSLARALPFASVRAFDVSRQTLDIARDNARTLGVGVDFVLCDILKASPPERPRYDIIVSNPPYVTESEAADMDARVRDFEPSLALFVPDGDPMLFYRAIARYAGKALVPGGRLYFEINRQFPAQIRDLLVNEGFTEVNALRDYLGNYRYCIAEKPL